MYSDKEFKNLFSPGPTVSLQDACKLSSYLVKAKACHTESKIGSCGCSKKH